jgi:ParB-like chromosome segregation protein Spo0J
MMSTIRHNRARGTHGVLRMADIVRRMVDEGVPERTIQKRLGMEREEVQRLVNRAGMPAQVGRGRGLNKAWVPGKG